MLDSNTEDFYRHSYHYPRYVSSNEILDQVVVENPDQLPCIILSVGPCRSGTNASLRVYAEAGISAYNQPFKGILRHLSKDRPRENCGFTIPAEPFVYLKETTGPFGCEECSLNAIELLSALFTRILSHRFSEEALDAAVRSILRSKVHVVVMGREPNDTWYSWDEAYYKLLKGVSEDERWYYELPVGMRFEFFISAYKQVEHLRQLALGMGIPVTHYVAEANREPDKAVTALFNRIGIPVAPNLTNWSQTSCLGVPGSRSILSSDHATQVRACMFDKVNDSEGIQFFPGRGNKLSYPIKKAIESAGLGKIFEGWRMSTESDLGLTIPLPTPLLSAGLL